MKRTIALLYGGKSGEHEVSRRSAASVLKNLDRAAYEPVCIGIDYDGTWYLQSMNEVLQEDTLRISRDETRVVSALPGRGLFVHGEKLVVHAVFPVLHGTFGEDGTVQGLLELCNLPYVGPGIMASSVSMDKDKTKLIWEHAGLPVVPWITVRKGEFKNLPDSYLLLKQRVMESLGFPVFVKPASCGSSVGVRKAFHPEELESALAEAFRYDMKVLIEKSISAREIECSVTGLYSDYTAYTPGEIIPRHEFYDYDAKYIDPDGASLRIPADITEASLEEIRNLSIAAFAALECEGLSRVDFFIEKTTGKIFLNEINTIPGFTSISMFPRMCEASGLAYPSLIGHLIDLAMRRAEEREQILYRKTDT